MNAVWDCRETLHTHSYYAEGRNATLFTLACYSSTTNLIFATLFFSKCLPKMNRFIMYNWCERGPQ